MTKKRWGCGLAYFLSQIAMYDTGIAIISMTQNNVKRLTMALVEAETVRLRLPVTPEARKVVTCPWMEGVRASPTMDRTRIEISPDIFFF